jgi:hypothetical protein
VGEAAAFQAHYVRGTSEICAPGATCTARAFCFAFPGTVVSGGGYAVDEPAGPFFVIENRFDLSLTWVVTVRNDGSNPISIIPFAVCATGTEVT